MLAARYNGNTEVVTQLLIENGAGVNAKVDRRSGLLYVWLLISGNTKDIVKALIEAGADLNAKDE